MEGLRKLVSALVVLAAGVIWASHAHSAAPTGDTGRICATPLHGDLVRASPDPLARADRRDAPPRH